MDVLSRPTRLHYHFTHARGQKALSPYDASIFANAHNALSLSLTKHINNIEVIRLRQILSVMERGNNLVEASMWNMI